MRMWYVTVYFKGIEHEENIQVHVPDAALEIIVKALKTSRDLVKIEVFKDMYSREKNSETSE